MKIVIEQDGILVSQATKDGFIKCKWGGCFDMAYPESKLRRGRVQEQGTVSPTITTGNSIVVVEKE